MEKIVKFLKVLLIWVAVCLVSFTLTCLVVWGMVSLNLMSLHCAAAIVLFSTLSFVFILNQKMYSDTCTALENKKLMSYFFDTVGFLLIYAMAMGVCLFIMELIFEKGSKS